ncbi:hypothetical protein ACT3CD_02925 [Geofilum sp. OHC36d9]|uniref:hypothetical protein n=1 Tax=Geofilum sp. OHC36d9 TaxID=3458413 RepID=UPI00403493EE
MRISQFQKYSQKENTVTNNVLLMLSRLNDLKVDYYKDIIEKISDGSQEYYPQANFIQQVNSKRGIIDGYIEVKASKIVIETKLRQKELVSKLTKYAEVFKRDAQNQLWHLSSKCYSGKEVEEINEKLKKDYPDTAIQFNNLTFLDLIENLEDVYSENVHDYELKLLYEDFRDYCYEENLVNDSSYKLLFVPTGFSYSWNKKYKMYFCPRNWHKQDFTYFGLYKNKSVRFISKIENVIIADFDIETKKLLVYKSRKETTERQLERLKEALIGYGESQNGLKYYLLPEDEFYSTDFRKESKGGIQGFRYKDLKHFIDKETLDSLRVDEIAEHLKTKIWK